MDDNIEENYERDRSPIRNQRHQQYQARSHSPLCQEATQEIPPDNDYCVLLENLSYTVEKEDLKRLFWNAKLEDDQILHLIGSNGRKTRTTFVLFRSLPDYCDALSNDKRQLHNRWISIRPISKEKMISHLDSERVVGGNAEGFQEGPTSFPGDSYSSKRCLVVRNLPIDVRKVEIMDFFNGFDVTEDEVYVLPQDEAARFGNAVITFSSEAEAMRAFSLNGNRFLGSEVLLKCVSMNQLDFVPQISQGQFSQEHRLGQSSGRSNEAYNRPGGGERSDVRFPRSANVSQSYAKAEDRRGCDLEPYAASQEDQEDQGTGCHGGNRASAQNFDEPTGVKLINLPFQIRNEEIYDFCYGYRVIPGSVSRQYDQSGKPRNSATAVFESYQEALTAIQELSGRPIGQRRIKLSLV